MGDTEEQGQRDTNVTRSTATIVIGTKQYPRENVIRPGVSEHYQFTSYASGFVIVHA